MAGTVGVTFSIGASLSRTVASAFGTVQSRVRGLRSDLRGLETQSKAASRLSAAQARLQTARSRFAANPTEQMRAALRTAVREFGSAHRAAKEYGISLQNVSRAQEALTGKIERTRAALSRQQRLQANQAKRKELQGQVLGTVGAVMSVAAPVKLAIDYESNFADLKKVADFKQASDEALVRQDIFDAARRSGLSASGMTGIAAAAAESGAVNDADGTLNREKLKQFLSDASEMSIAYGISAEEAGERLAALQGRMMMTAEQTKAMGDAMNYVASKSNATAAASLQVVSRMGAVGKTAGLSEKSIVGLAAAFVSASENPETAGTAMKAFLLNLISGDAMSKKQKETFASIGITNVQAIAEGMKKGGAEAENTILTVLEAIKKAPESAQAGIAKSIFGMESLASVAPLINDPKVLQKFFGLANSKEAVGSQFREFETRSNTTQGALDRLKTSVGVLGITVGSVLLPPLATAANTATTFIKPVTALAERFPTVTKVVMLTAIALVALKVGALAGMYAATILSDGWTIARGVLAFFRPAVVLTNLSLVRQRAAALAAATGTRLMAAGAKVAAAGQWVLNAALSANPIGIVITAVAALVAGLVWLYNTCEPVRAAFDAAFSWIGDKVGWVVGKLRAVGEFLGLVDEAEDKADSKLAEKGKSVPPPAAAPPVAAAPQAWDPDAALAAMSPEARNAAFPGAGAASMPAGMGSMGGGASPVSFDLNVSLNGMPDKEFGQRVIEGLKRRQSEFEALVASVVDEQRRLAYG